MDRDFGQEIDALRAEVQAIAQELASVRRQQGQTSAGAPLAPSAGRPDKMQKAMELEKLARARGASGLVEYAGCYGSGSRGYIWETGARSTDDLLGQDVEKVAKVLSALGNKQRLEILKAILTEPASASELVDRLGMGTAGQAYHHLKALQAADLISQEERGQFIFRGYRVQGLMMLLAGVCDLIDSRHASGVWDQGKAED